MPSLTTITKKIASLNQNLDGITDDLVKELDKYQREYERLLRNKNFDLDNGRLKPTQANFNKAQSMNPMQTLGMREIGVKHIKEYSGVAKNQIQFNQSLYTSLDFDYKDITALKRLQELDFTVFQQEALLLDARIKRELVNYIALETPYQQAVDNLASNMLGAGDKAGTLAGFANTYMRTALFSLSKQIDMEIYNKFDVKQFVYAGPVDKLTRGFCMRHVGKTYNRSQIEEFSSSNGSGLDPFINPGGYNCRHRLVAKEDLL